VGLLDSVKGVYQSAEDLYYDVLDGVNETVPVYSVIDPIDKVFPSFALFIIAILVLLAGGLFAISGGISFPIGDTLTVSVLDSKNIGIGGASVTFTKKGTEIGTGITNARGFAKQAGLSKDDTIDLRVEKEDYLTSEETITIDELPKTKIINLQKVSESFVEKTIRLVDDLGSPIREPVTLEFRCSNTLAPGIKSQQLSAGDRGTATVNVPGNCGKFTVSVRDSVKYRDVSGLSVTGEDEVIHLQDAQPQGANGILTARIVDSSGNGIDGIQVNLYKYAELSRDPHVGPITSSFTSGGQANFTVSAGDYTVKTYDTAGVYGEVSSSKVTVPAAGTQSVSLTLTETIKGKIKVTVVNASSKSPIAGARVKLTYAGNTQLATLTTDSSGKAQFNISRDVEYTATASADGYAIGTASGLRLGSTDYNINLTRCTPATCGSLRVQVIDQEANPVQNATVALYDAKTNSAIGTYSTRATDINGIARFPQVSTGKYYAFAFKEGFSGTSDTGDFDSTQSQSSTEPNLKVKMEIGDGTVQVNVRDDEGVPVPFAAISMIDARTGALVKSDFTDNNGSKEFTQRADRKIYLVVSKKDDPNFAAYTTVAKPIIPSGTQTFDVTLEKRVLKNNIELQFLGLYLGTARASNLKAGLTYTAKLKLYVPEEKNYRSGGAHLRTGDDVLMEKDKIFIKEVNAPRSSQIKATRLEPEASGLDEKDYLTTIDDAKWASLYWNSPQAGIYEIEAQIGVRDSASIGDKLPLYYRAWGEKGAGGRDRFPVDETVSKDLYANTKQEIFQVDTVTLCDEKFCFAATITDQGKSGDSNQPFNLTESVTETYNARVFNPYNLKFVITNNSGSRIHNSANLRISNLDKAIKFFDYKLTNAETREVGGVLNGFDFPFLDVGSLGPKNSARFEAGFTPQRAGSGLVNIKLVSDQAVVFDKTITIIVSSPSELSATLSPESFLSGVENDITVTVKDVSTGLEVDGAVVRVKDRHGNMIDSDITLADGTAKVTLPGQKPGEKLKIEIEKPNYNVKVIELAVSDQLLEIKPDQIGAALNTKSKLTSEDKFSVRNISPYALTIKGISLSGNFQNNIDMVKVRGWLESSYRGMVLQPNEKQDMTLRTYLTEDARSLPQRKSYEGELTVVAGNFGQEWVFKKPVKIAVGLGDEVDNPACLVLTKNDWTATTTGSPKYTEVQIQNNCTVGGKTVPLQGLEAKVDWKGNQIGTYSLTFNLDSDNKEGQKVDLRSGYFRKLVGTVRPEQTISAILTFTPFGGVSGVANAEITVQASNPLDAQDQILTNKIKTTITATTLTDCLTYDKERLVLNRGENGTISVTATDKCGEPVKLTLESKIRTTPKKDFTLEPGKTQAIEVFSENSDPGQYPLYLTAKFGSQTKQQLTKNLRVLINQPGCWQISKYEFDVYDSPNTTLDGFDTANFSNTCVEKPVAVRVNTKDFMKALKNGAVWGLATMGLTMLTNAADPNVDWMGRATDPKTGELIQQKEKNSMELRAKAAELNKKADGLDAKAAQDPGNKKLADEAKTAREAAKKAELSAATEKQEADKLRKQLAEQQAKAGSTGAKTTSTTGSTDPNYIERSIGNATYYSYDGGQTWYDDGESEVTDAQLVTNLKNPGKRITAIPPAGKTQGTQPAGTAVTPPVKVVSLPEAEWVPTPANLPPLGNGETYTGTFNLDGTNYYRASTGVWLVLENGDIIGLDSRTKIDKLNKAWTEFQKGPNSGNVVLVPGVPFAILPSSQGLVAGITGYAAGTGNNATGVASSVATQLGGGIFGNALGGGAGLVRGLLGTSPWASGLLGFVAGTAISYMSQQEETSFSAMQKDAELKDFKLVQGSPPNEKPDLEIKLDIEGFGTGGAPTAPQPIVNNPNLVSQGSESFRLTFTNAKNFTTTEDKPKYKTLKAEGIRHTYKDKVYDKDAFINEKGGLGGQVFTSSVLDKTKTKLEEDAPKPLEQRWSLEFNSVPPQIETPQRPDLLLNCQAGEKVGSTGPDALPKVKLAWNWNAIDEKSCNEDNKSGIYCDATQFSIALLKKIHFISDYVSSKGAEFQCPSPVEDEPAKIEIGVNDIGIASVAAVKEGTKVTLVAQLKNTNPGEVGAAVRMRAIKVGAQGELACPEGMQNVTINGGGVKEVKCTFPTLTEGLVYMGKVEITPSVSCAKCADKANTNTLTKNFFVGRSGLQVCSPYSTARLDKFIQASGIAGADSYIKMTKFKATLMQDGYSTDFQRDFDIAQRQAFFNAPDYYKNTQSSLGTYFKDPKLFNFDAYSQPDFTLPGPGTYDVTIDINYSDNTWQLFDDKGNPKANITITMQKLRGAQPDNPFYYTPFDGLVGDGGRTGYGVNFNGDPILIDNSPNPIRAVDIAGSSPIENGVLSITRGKSFQSMQVGNAGVVANLNRANGNPQLLFQPSNATPVILQIDKKSGSDAYAVYQVGVDGDAVDVGPTMAKWNGVGILCRAFNDEILAQQQNVPDTHMIGANCSVARSGDRSLYTLEFCGEPKRFGTASYETIFYTPQESDSFIKLSGAASDVARLIGVKTKAQNIELNGNDVTRKINSMQDIFDLVANQYMCVSSTSLNSEFFWNPKKIYGLINSREEDAINACIASENSNIKATGGPAVASKAPSN